MKSGCMWYNKWDLVIKTCPWPIIGIRAFPKERMMLERAYETMYIIDNAINEDEKNAIVAKFDELIATQGTELQKSEKIGTKKLAYLIDGAKEGYYVLSNFRAKPDFILELERQFNINENIVRFIVLKTAK